MKTLMCLFAISLLCGCVYEVPLVEKAVIPVDPVLTGTWQEIPDEGDLADPDARMVVLAFSTNEYIVVCSPAEDAAFYRAYLVQVDDFHLMQLEGLGIDPSESKNYIVCRYSVKDGVLTFKTLNEAVISDEIKDSAALREALLVNRDNPDLFDSPDRYRKLED